VIGKQLKNSHIVIREAKYGHLFTQNSTILIRQYLIVNLTSKKTVVSEKYTILGISCEFAKGFLL